MPELGAKALLIVILAGVAGMIANAGAAALYLGWDKIALALMPGRYIVAILCAAVLPFIGVSRGAGTVASLSFLIIVPSLLAKLAFGATAPWTTVLALNSVYALATWGAWRLLRRRV